MNWYKLSKETMSLFSFTLPTKDSPSGTIQFIKWLFSSKYLSNEEAYEIIERAKVEQNSDDVLTFEAETDWPNPDKLQDYARNKFRNPWIKTKLIPSISIDEFEKEL